MSGSPYDEVVRAMEWLEEATGLPGEKSVAHCLAAKVSTSLLPVARVLGYRRRLSALPLSRGMELFLWRVLRGSLKMLLIGRKWPETMEIHFGGRSQEGPAPQAGNDDRPTVCIAASMESYGSTVTHLARALVSQGARVEVLTPGSAGSWGGLRNLPDSCKPLPFEWFVDDEMERKYEKGRRVATESWSESADRIRREGPPILKDMLSIAPSQLKYVAEEVIPQTRMYREMAQAALEAIRPKSLFIMRLRRITESVFAEAAKGLGIAVFLANHGHMGSRWDPLSLGGVDRQCNVVLSWNQDQADTWLHLFPRLDRTRVHTVGGIQWDEPIKRFSGHGRVGRAELRQRIGALLGNRESRPLEPDDKWVTITMDVHVRRFFGKVLQALADIKGIRVIIKMRPHETEEEYRNLLIRQPVEIVSRGSNVQLFDLLHASDLVVTCASTTNLDALSVGTPVMTLTMDRESRLLDRYVWLERFGLPVCSSEEELKRTLGHWVNRPEKQAEWREAALRAAGALLSNYPLGDAGEKIARLVRSFSGADTPREHGLRGN